jgi:Transmembrane secretion effector
MEASGVDTKSHGGAVSTAGSSAWAALAPRIFALMASAQFVSNSGGWVQTVGAQKLMLTLTTSVTLVALIQPTAGLPLALLCVSTSAIVIWLTVAACPRKRPPAVRSPPTPPGGGR